METQTKADLNDVGKFRNHGNVMNVGNIGNIRTDIKSQTFTEPQSRADVNDDGHFKNGGMSKIPGMSRKLIHAHNINFVVQNCG